MSHSLDDPPWPYTPVWLGPIGPEVRELMRQDLELFEIEESYRKEMLHQRTLENRRFYLIAQHLHRCGWDIAPELLCLLPDYDHSY